MNALQKYINNDYSLINSYLRNNIETMTDYEINKSMKLINQLDCYIDNNKIKKKYKFRVYRGIRNKKNRKYDYYTNTQKAYVSASFSERIALNNYTNNGGFLLIIDITPDIPYIIVNPFMREYNSYDEDEDEILLPRNIKLIPTKIIDKDSSDNEHSYFGITIVYCNASF